MRGDRYVVMHTYVHRYKASNKTIKQVQQLRQFFIIL